MATYSNGRTAAMAAKGVCPAFVTAFRAGEIYLVFSIQWMARNPL
jgi:Na+/H+-translocating membrane pyrophosphatase